MANLKADSPLSRRIVLSFLDFLNSVEFTSDCDLESLEVAEDCLLEVFKIDSSSSTSSVPKSDSLVHIFSSQPGPDNGIKSDSVNDPVYSKTPDASQTLGVTDKQDNDTIGVSEDELFAQFYDAQEKAGLFDMYTPDEANYRACGLFNCALEDMEEYGVEVLNLKNLADIFKLKGNDAMLFKWYPDAIFLYTIAIALCVDNAIYYCNRAAAYTHDKKYSEAISDCETAIEINPSYSKAYSRLGYVYFVQGNYSDAINKGYKKALQLDPENESVKENIQVSKHILRFD
ncbi:uncharacterized protein [Rutidosis leptorrhynchoides]|uniref:uncharacterized protein n=1 Tax=Rutidosis leptorrhynchoides TaxID=125765 RepID=UPI003A99F9E4